MCQKSIIIIIHKRLWQKKTVQGHGQIALVMKQGYASYKNGHRENKI